MALAHDGAALRRLATWGVRTLPRWFVRASPPAIGVLAAAVLPRHRRAVRDNLRRIRSGASAFDEVVDVARTFAAYASTLAEGMAPEDVRRGVVARVVEAGGAWRSADETDAGAADDAHCRLDAVLAAGKGAILVTAHVGGWDVVGPLLAARTGAPFLMVMEEEPDAGAARIHDDVRGAKGVGVARLGADPMGALPLLRHLRDGGVLGIQLDRAPPGRRTRAVRLLDRVVGLPEGPLRLAQASGAPLVPIFCAREGHLRYRVELHAPIAVPRRLDDGAMDAIAQALADAMAAFIRENPTQWFHFEDAAALRPEPAGAFPSPMRQSAAPPSARERQGL
jgi:KDO2-lipid IV(A) lauroyltransferase